VQVIIDTREKAADRAQIIKQFPKTKYPNLHFTEQALKEGDILVKCENDNQISCLIERKSVSDLYGSIMGTKGHPARFPEQCVRLLTHQGESVVILLVTGDIHKYIAMRKKRHGLEIDPDIFDSFIASVMTRYNIRVLVDDDNMSGIKRAIKVGIKCCEGGMDLVQSRNLDALISRFLNITLVQWRAIKSTYGTDLTYIATKADLSVIPGIGKVKERRIKELIIGKSSDWMK